MGRVKYASDVAVPVDVAFAYVDNYVFVPDWLVGVSRFEPVGERDQGLGAVFETTVQFGPLRQTFETRISNYQRNVCVELTSSGRLGSYNFGFAELGCGRSVLTLEYDYPRRRGPVWLSERTFTALANRAIRRTERRLRKGIEQYYGVDPVGRIA